MQKIITTTESYSKTVRETDLRGWLADRGVEVILHYQFVAPFPFDPKDVFAIVAGHTPKGEMLHVGPGEASFFPNLKVVSPFGVGMNHIDLIGFAAAGIDVKTLPHMSRRTVAELVFAFIFALARRVVPQTIAIRNGEWQRQEGYLIEGKTLGIVGLGMIGKEVAKMGKALGMVVVANDLVYDDEFNREYGIEVAEREEVVRRSDYLTLHVPLTEETDGFINREAIKSMKRGAFFINAARGEVVDELALYRAIATEQLAGAALDVFSEEPPFRSNVLSKLIGHPNVLSTPHIGAYTPETRYTIAKYVSEILLPYAAP